MEALINWIVEWVIGLTQTNPHVATLFILIGALRSVFKPLMSAWAAYVEYTDTKKDDEKFEEFKKSRFYAAIIWLLDFTASIKVKK